MFPTVTTLEIYDRSNGQYVTNVDLKSALRSDAVGVNGVVFLGEAYKSGARGAALDITQPYVAVKWEVMFPTGGMSAAPALRGDAVYFAGENGSVIAVSVNVSVSVASTSASSLTGMVTVAVVAPAKIVTVPLGVV